MSDQMIQLIRTLVKAAWGAVFGLTVVDRFLIDAGLDAEWAKGVAITATVGVIVAITQRLPANRAGNAVGTVLTGVNRPPAYTNPPTG